MDWTTKERNRPGFHSFILVPYMNLSNMCVNNSYNSTSWSFLTKRYGFTGSSLVLIAVSDFCFVLC